MSMLALGLSAFSSVRMCPSATLSLTVVCLAMSAAAVAVDVIIFGQHWSSMPPVYTGRSC